MLSRGLPDTLKMIRTITTVCINGLEEAKGDPDIDGEYVQVLREEAVNQRTENGSSPQNEDFRRVSVFGCQSERCRVLVVNLMNVLIEWPSVKRLVSCSRELTGKLGGIKHSEHTTEVEKVFKAKEKENLRGHGFQRRERNMICLHAK